MMAKALLLVILTLSNFIPYVLSVDCISVQGNISASPRGSLSISKFSDPYSFVSCGFKTNEFRYWFKQGSYISKNDGSCNAVLQKLKLHVLGNS